MSYVLVASPDKISLGSFLRFISVYFPEHEYGEIHSLMSDEALTLYVTDFSNQFPDGIFSYYAKRMVNRDPMTCLPKAAFDKADVVVWFDLYSTDPKILKDTNGCLSVAVEAWKQYIQKIS
jgi:hypothetical protein